MKNISRFCAIAIGAFIGGCGGGGGSIGPAPLVGTAPATGTPTATPPATTASQVIVVQLNNAISELYGQPHQFINTVKSSSGDSYEGRVIYSNVVDASIENKSGKSVDIQRTVLKNGTLLLSSSETSFFQIDPYRLTASKSKDNSLYIVASNQVALPPTAKAGDFGTYYDSTTYDSIEKNIVLVTSKHTWTVSAESPTTVLFCDVSVNTVAQVAGTTTRSDCYQIDTNSQVVSNRLVVPGLN